MLAQLQVELATLFNQITTLQQQLMNAKQINNLGLAFNLERELGIATVRYETAYRRYQSMLATQQQQPQQQQQYYAPPPPQQYYGQPQQPQQYMYAEQYNPNIPAPNFNYNIRNDSPIFGHTGGGGNPGMIQNSTEGMGNRYATKPTLVQTPMRTQVAVPKPAAVEKKLLPLPGNEFPYLLATGLYAEVVQNGDYFQYDIKGEIYKSPNIPSVLTFNNADIESLTTETLLKNLVLTEYMGVSYKTYQVTKHCYEIDETLFCPLEDDNEPANFNEFELDKKEFASKTAKYKNAGNFDETVLIGGQVISFLTKYSNTVFSALINKALTRRLNDLFEKSYSLVGFTVDDFHEDFEEFTMRYIPAVEDLNKQIKLQRALGLVIVYAIDLINSITCVGRLEANDSTDESKVYTNFIHVTYTSEHDVLHLTVDNITSVLMENVISQPMVVTEMGHRDLFNILSEYKFKHMTSEIKPKSNFGLTQVGKIATHDEYQKIIMYSVFVNKENYIIVKD